LRLGEPRAVGGHRARTSDRDAEHESFRAPFCKNTLLGLGRGGTGSFAGRWRNRELKLRSIARGGRYLYITHRPGGRNGIQGSGVLKPLTLLGVISPFARVQPIMDQSSFPQIALEKFPVGQRVTLPGHFLEPVTLESVRFIGSGYECRVRLPDGTPDEAILSQEEGAALAGHTVITTTLIQPADAEKLRLLVESARIRLAYAHEASVDAPTA
jgi:hypothetical protein